MSFDSSWKYPFDGFIYLLRHPSLWKRIFFGLILLLCFSLTIFILFIVYIYPLQLDIISLSIVRWLSIILSLILTLFEIGFVVLIVSCLFLTFRLKRIYEIIWKEEFGDQSSLIEISSLKTFICLIFFRIFLFLLTYPLNLIPILGTILFLYLNSYYYSWSLHYPYFNSIGLSFQQGKNYVERNEKSYREFGFVALIFELIPFINLISPITNMIGSILWIVDIEKSSLSSEHPRSYLLSPTPLVIEQGNQQYYGTTRSTINDEKSFYSSSSFVPPPPNYNDIIRNQDQQISPSAPHQDDKT